MSALAALEASGIDAAALLKRLQAEQQKRADENRLAAYVPYGKQTAFHHLGTRERLMLACNQGGKTIAGGAESAMHLTGIYPDWWKGQRFERPVRMWASGETSKATRDNVQTKLMGPPEREAEWGTGYIPKRAIKSWSRAQGTPNLLDSVSVRHVTGGYSTLWFKSYEQGRQNWQGPTLDIVWFDEEPPPDIYSEGLTRTNAVPDALVYLTFTPLLGMSDVVKMYLMKPTPERSSVTMTIDEVEHFTPEQREKIAVSYQPHEREARTKGIPVLGSGRIFPIAEESIVWNATKLPKHFKRIVGIDFGWDHPTAAAWVTWDADSDTVYVTDCYRVRQATPIIHAAAIKARGAKIPVAWPHDGLQHDNAAGEQLAELYRKQGVAMLPERAQFPDDRGNSVEAGVVDMLQRMQTGRLKVAAHLADWWEEFRLYHRKDGKIVKVGEDVLSATRYAIMCLRFAKPGGEHPSDPYRRPNSGAGSYMTA